MSAPTYSSGPEVSPRGCATTWMCLMEPSGIKSRCSTAQLSRLRDPLSSRRLRNPRSSGWVRSTTKSRVGGDFGSHSKMRKASVDQRISPVPMAQPKLPVRLNLWASEIGLAAAQGVLGPLARFDIGVGSIPFDDVALLIAQRRGTIEEPAILPVGAADAAFAFPRLSGSDALVARLHDVVNVVGMVHDAPAQPLGLAVGEAGEVEPPLIQKVGPAVRQNAKDESWDGVDGELKLLFLPKSLSLGDFPLGNVVVGFQNGDWASCRVALNGPATGDDDLGAVPLGVR